MFTHPPQNSSPNPHFSHRQVEPAFPQSPACRFGSSGRAGGAGLNPEINIPAETAPPRLQLVKQPRDFCLEAPCCSHGPTVSGCTQRVIYRVKSHGGEQQVSRVARRNPAWVKTWRQLHTNHKFFVFFFSLFFIPSSPPLSHSPAGDGFGAASPLGEALKFLGMDVPREATPGLEMPGRGLVEI